MSFSWSAIHENTRILAILSVAVLAMLADLNTDFFSLDIGGIRLIFDFNFIGSVILKVLTGNWCTDRSQYDLSSKVLSSVHVFLAIAFQPLLEHKTRRKAHSHDCYPQTVGMLQTG